MAGEPMAATAAVRRRSTMFKSEVISWILVLSGLYWFAASFFLAKQSLSQLSQCDEACSLLDETLGLNPSICQRLQERQILASQQQDEQRRRRGCWMDRKVDSLVMVVIDALRFDFALYDLPKSIGHHLNRIKEQQQQQQRQQQQQKQPNQKRDWSFSHLMQFVADPPTVTMQRLKALTTGGLPTFADISANLGGASVDEDSWVQMLRRIPGSKRGLEDGIAPQSGFVGDDTWIDLYPKGFTDAFPYPSFNTRDLDTVDNGCEKHLPELVERLRKGNRHHHDPAPANELELLVVHFLGVDHVGHTYGPHNQHMDAKLRQMDNDLKLLLDKLDGDDSSEDSCHVALIFGDHGMTEDGNHGGGTEEEISAALFVHFSPGCPPPALSHSSYPQKLELQRKSDLVNAVFGAIHQIDLVPSLSLLLGLPMPFANLGSLAPSLIPGLTAQQTATALALNAAQVWRYFTVYSATANRLPGLPALQNELDLAVAVFQKAVLLEEDDKNNNNQQEESVARDDHYVQSAIMFKNFLQNALELGQRVWTRFDGFGMVGGICVLGLGMIVSAWPLLHELVGVAVVANRSTRPTFSFPRPQTTEIALATVFMLFLCGLLTFSNSYILEEENSIMYCLSVLSMAIALRIHATTLSSSSSSPAATWKLVLALPILSRLGELFVSGHGLDPSIRLHWAHHSGVFLTSLCLLGLFRWILFQMQIVESKFHLGMDLLTLFCLACSWWEKRSPDLERTGYAFARMALSLLAIGIVTALGLAIARQNEKRDTGEEEKYVNLPLRTADKHVLTVLIKVMIAMMTVTGPAAAASFVIFTIQVAILFVLSASIHFPTMAAIRPNSMVVAALLRLITRHAFFATNHGCAFNRLQLSAAFIATSEFYYEVGGISLFLNTFGWEMLGITLAWLFSRQEQQHRQQTKGQSAVSIWRMYALFHMLEAITSCISVSVLRRHLMVWDIYAPHFIFAAIFTVLHGLAHLSAELLDNGF